MTSSNPPRWAERLLSVILKPRDRESVAGDLLEEYREVVVPTRGRVRRQLWYVKQVLSLTTNVQFGTLLGLVFSTAAVFVNVLAPLAHVTLPELPYGNSVYFGALFAWFGIAGYRVDRGNGDVRASIRAGAIAALVGVGLLMMTFGVIHLGRHNGMIKPFEPLPAFVVLGAFCGAMGGFANRIASALIK